MWQPTDQDTGPDATPGSIARYFPQTRAHTMSCPVTSVDILDGLHALALYQPYNVGFVFATRTSGHVRARASSRRHASHERSYVKKTTSKRESFLSPTTISQTHGSCKSRVHNCLMSRSMARISSPNVCSIRNVFKHTVPRATTPTCTPRHGQTSKKHHGTMQIINRCVYNRQFGDMRCCTRYRGKERTGPCSRDERRGAKWFRSWPAAAGIYRRPVSVSHCLRTSIVGKQSGS